MDNMERRQNEELLEARRLRRQEQKRLCAECSLITEKALRQRKLKTFARKLLGRS